MAAQEAHLAQHSAAPRTRYRHPSLDTSAKSPSVQSGLSRMSDSLEAEDKDVSGMVMSE